MLRGRRAECEVLDGLLEGVRAGRSGALIVRGEAGIGETALLDSAIEQASDLRIACAVGVESEIELAFAALHQLCVPMLERLERLPCPQSGALPATFGLSWELCRIGSWSGWRYWACCRRCAEARPLVCVVDDAQWLDRASAQTSAFFARRLLAESMWVCFGERERSDEFSGLPELVVEGSLGEATRASSWTRWFRGRWMSERASRSSRKRAVTRWRCWSCPGACRLCPGVSGDPQGLEASRERRQDAAPSPLA
jgi:hypothetical protein